MSHGGPTSHGFPSQRTRLNYVDWGNPAAPLLLLLHGSRDHCRSWDRTAAALRQDWHVVAPDLRGHGDSAWSPEGRYDFASYVYDLAQLVFHLGEMPVTIVAHSLGAHIALRYAGLYPDAVRRLVAVEAVGLPPEIEAKQRGSGFHEQMRRWIADKRAASSRQPRRYATIEDAMARMIAENPDLGEAQARDLTIHGILRNEDGSWSWKFDNHLRVGPFPDVAPDEIVALWRRIRCPTLLVRGGRSWPSDVPDALAGTLFDARAVEIGGAGHWPQHDQFDRFIALVEPFLRGDGERPLP